MIRTAIVLSAVCVVCRSSGISSQIEHPIGVQVGPPAVVASSSQYFERTFNRLIAAPPVIPVVPAPPVLTVQPLPKNPPTAVPDPTTQQILPQEPPNIAVAIATAFAAAPVSTILLPPSSRTKYPFGLPPSIGVIPTEEPKKRDPEPTTSTQRSTTRNPESVTPQASNTDNFAQGLPSNTNFNQYAAPPFQQIPLQMTPPRPIKLKTSVEVVPVPLQYIAPPPLRAQPIKHIHTYIPTRARIIIRRVRPSRLIIYKRPIPSRVINQRLVQGAIPRPLNRDVEPTTFRPSNRQSTKPPRR